MLHVSFDKNVEHCIDTRLCFGRYSEAKVYSWYICEKKYSIQLKRPCDIFEWRIGNKLLVIYACYDVLINYFLIINFTQNANVTLTVEFILELTIEYQIRPYVTNVITS